MKKLVTAVTVLAGAAVVIAAVLQRMVRFSRVWIGAAGAAGVVGKGPGAAFAVKRISSQTVLGLLRKIGTSVSSAGAAYLWKHGRKQ